MDTSGSRKKRFTPFFILRSWWKRRRFQYLVHVDTQEECNMEEYRGGGIKTSTELCAATEKAFIPPLALYFEAIKSNAISDSFASTPTINSFQDSIESMDSIIDSRCIRSEDKTSQPVGFTDTFLMEHLSFLSQSTLPQEVELVYDTH